MGQTYVTETFFSRELHVRGENLISQRLNLWIISFINLCLLFSVCGRCLIAVQASSGLSGCDGENQQVIQTLVSPVPELSFLPAPYRGSTRADERRVQDNLYAYAQDDAIFFPQIGGKTIFGSSFQICVVARFSE